MRATIFEALHEMSSVLNSSLELGEVLERLAAKISVLVSYDLCIFAHYDDKNSEIGPGPPERHRDPRSGGPLACRTGSRRP